MANAKDFAGRAEKILAVGTGGGGKTSGFMSLPGKKFIYIFDPSALATLRGKDIDYELYTPDILNLNAVTLKTGVADNATRPAEPRTYVDFETDFEDKLRSGFFDDYDVIGFDSMTTFSDIVMDRIMYLNGRFGKWPEQADWTATMNTIKNVMRTLTSIPGKVVYVTAHVEYKQDGEGGRFMNVLSLIGRLRNSLPLLFSEIWQFSGDKDTKGNQRFYITTAPDRQSPYLRSTLRGLAPVEDVTIENWENPEKYGIGALIKKATA